MYDMYIRIVARMHAHTHESYAHHVHRARMMHASCTQHMRIITHHAHVIGIHARGIACMLCDDARMMRATYTQYARKMHVTCIVPIMHGSYVYMHVSSHTCTRHRTHARAHVHIVRASSQIMHAPCMPTKCTQHP